MMAKAASAERVTMSALHHAILTHIVECGFAPEPDELAREFDVSLAEMEAALQRLQREHGVVLHPSSARIWVAHPFATAPTGHVVRRGDRIWWSSCAWCSLGAATLLGGSVSIGTSIGGESLPVELHVDEGTLRETDLVVHFPIPMRHAWDNVVYTCSTMLFFENDSDVGAWCARHRIPKGDVRPASKVAELARAWYSGHLRRDWTKWTAAEARAIFERLGLTHDVWRLPKTDQRF